MPLSRFLAFLVLTVGAILTLLPVTEPLAQPALVASGATTERAPDTTALDQVIARLDEEDLEALLDVRSLILAEAERRALSRDAGQRTRPLLTRLEHHLRAASTALGWVVAQVTGKGEGPPVWVELALPGVVPDVGRMALILLASLGAGTLALVAWRRIMARTRRWIVTLPAAPAKGPRLGRALERVALRTVLDGVGVGLFALAGVMAWLLMSGGAELNGAGADRETRYALFYFYSVLTVLLFDLGARAILAPATPLLRVLPASDAHAAALHRMVLIQASLSAVGFVTCGLVFTLTLPDGFLITAVTELHHLMVIAVGLAMVAGQIVWTWRTNGHMRALFLTIVPADHPDATSPLAQVPWINRLLARVWAPALTVFLSGLFLTWASWIALDRPQAVTVAIVALALVMLAPLITRGIHLQFLRWGHRPVPLRAPPPSQVGLNPAAGFFEEQDSDRDDMMRQAEQQAADQRAREAAEDAEQDRQQRQQRRLHLAVVFSQVSRAALILLLIAVIFGLSGYQADSWGMGSFGEKLHEAIITLIATGLLGWLAYGAMRAAIDPFVVRHAGAADEDAAGRAMTRTQTILPLLRLSLSILIASVVGLILLSTVGVNIAPLLAGAGIIGLAIGFGAQALVKDIISGIFFLIDDAFRVGEYIEFGDLRGEVEAITLRSLRLRHHRGAIHTIPFGEIGSITNYSRDWVIYKFTLRLPYDTDIEKVRKLIKKTGQTLMEHPEHGPNLIQPLKSQGIVDMDDSALVMRVKFMCKPRRQFMIRRQAYLMIMTALNEAGIDLATRSVNVTVQTVEEAKAAAAGAVAAAPDPAAPALTRGSAAAE